VPSELALRLSCAVLLTETRNRTCARAGPLERRNRGLIVLCCAFAMSVCRPLAALPQLAMSVPLALDLILLVCLSSFLCRMRSRSCGVCLRSEALMTRESTRNEATVGTFEITLQFFIIDVIAICLMFACVLPGCRTVVCAACCSTQWRSYLENQLASASSVSTLCVTSRVRLACLTLDY
jgi:hypothetical protein